MKRVISGKTYDTDTSDEVVRWSYTGGDTQFSYEVSVSLYRTQKEAYFEVHSWVDRNDHAQFQFKAVSDRDVEALLRHSNQAVEILRENMFPLPPEDGHDYDPSDTDAKDQGGGNRRSERMNVLVQSVTKS